MSELTYRVCRSCRHRLEGIDSRACPECGARFDPDDPSTYVRSIPNAVRYRVTSPVSELWRVRDLLERGGVAFIVKESIAAFGVGVYTVLVPAEQQERADALLAGPASATQATVAWTCPCGEVIAGFSVCWSCGRDADGQ